MSTTARSRHSGESGTSTTSHDNPVATSSRAIRFVTAVLRLSLGWVFLWAFLDKTFALGFAKVATPRQESSTRSDRLPG